MSNSTSADYPEFQTLFLKSALCDQGSFMSLAQTIQWIEEQNKRVRVDIRKIPFAQLNQWEMEHPADRIRHSSGKFFSIDGIRVRTNWGSVKQWDQPIINQPEIGYLGFITRVFNGVLHFLVQAKIEPGNVNFVQLSPTLQATRSNYTQIHQGKKPLYLEYFQSARPEQIMLDQLQSEQGARFLRKRNRNIILLIEEEIEVHENFTWLTLGQIKKLMHYDNLVNMDTRTVISGIPVGHLLGEPLSIVDSTIAPKGVTGIQQELLKSAVMQHGAYHSFEYIIAFMTQLKSNYDLEVEKIPLHKLDKWIVGENEIYHEQNKYFKIIAVDVEIGNREVVRWSQPMVEPAQEGLCAFVCKIIHGVLHFAVQGKLECGNFDTIEFAPTVQCLTGNYRQTQTEGLPFLHYVLNAPHHSILLDALQSEEGGRFYKEQNRNRIVLAGDEIPLELPPNFIWMTLNQLNTFIQFNNYLNIQARSLISAISFIA